MSQSPMLGADARAQVSLEEIGTFTTSAHSHAGSSLPFAVMRGAKLACALGSATIPASRS